MDSTTSKVSISAMAGVPLSHKWIFHGAGTFLRNSGRPKERPVATSQPFSVSTPSKESYTGNQTSIWHMSLKRTGGSNGGCFFSLYLYHGHPKFSRDSSANEKSSYDEDEYSEVVVCNCKFSFLHPVTNNVLNSRTLGRSFGCVLNDERQQICYLNRVRYNDIIIDDTLTIELYATLLCVDDPIEREVTCTVPLDEIRSEMHRLYKDEVLSDATVQCEDKSFKVHKAILASQSTVFQKMFEVDMKEKNSGIVEITDTSPAAVSDLVDYFYTGSAPNAKFLAKELLNLANKYELPRLFTLCENELKMKIKVTNVVETLVLADLHKAAELKEACLSFIRQNS